MERWDNKPGWQWGRARKKRREKGNETRERVSWRDGIASPAGSGEGQGRKKVRKGMEQERE